MLLVLLAFLCFMILYWKRKHYASSIRQPPVHPGALPLLGHLHLLVGDSKHTWRLVKRISYECINAGHVTTFWMGSRCIYVITDPDDCLTVANSCLGKDLIYELAKPCFGEGLVMAPVSIWKEHRKLLNPAFNLNFLNEFLAVFNNQAKLLVEELERESGQGLFIPEHYLRNNEMKTISTTSLGLDFSKYAEVQQKYANAFDSIFKILVERFQKFWLLNEFIWNRSSLRKEHDKNVKTLHNISDLMIQEKRQNKNNHKIEGGNFRPFLDIFFDINLTSEKQIFSDKSIRDHVNTLIIAGHDSISITLQYILLFIGSYHHVQDRLYAELQDVFNNSKRDVEKEDLPKLVYMDAVIKETMRMYPLVPIIARYIEKDVKLKNYTLRSGNGCLLMIYGVHRHPMWGNDAEQFKPERWLNPSSVPKNPNTFIPFSLGRRVCLGKTYAMMSLKVTLVHILRHYCVTGDHTILKNKLDVMLKPVTGHQISINRRT